MSKTLIPLPKGTIDESGHQYGRLEVLDYAGREEDGHAAWRVRCDCGTITTVRGARLRAHRQVSCGCERADPEIRQAARMQVPAKRRQEIAQMGADTHRKDLSGQPFGHLEAIRLIRMDSSRHAIYQCRCTCPAHPKPIVLEVRGSKLAAGAQTSCGASRGGARPGSGRPRKAVAS
jgi:hypothetical protein